MTVYLSGCVRDDLPAGVGVIVTPQMGNKIPDGRTWAADTGCFNAPDKYDDAAYLLWLWERRHARDRCLFATAPDAMGDFAATWARARKVLPLIRALGFPAALVAQPGIEDRPVPWDAFDVFFLGGPDEWKFVDPKRPRWLIPALERLIAEAKERGKHVHIGRVNSLKRLRMAADLHADSADGTFVAFGPDVNGERVRGWCDDLAARPSLFMRRAS